MEKVEEIAPPASFIGLFSGPMTAALYARAGFSRSETGMNQHPPWVTAEPR